MSTKEQSLLVKLARKVVGLPTGDQSCCGPASSTTGSQAGEARAEVQSNTCCGGAEARVETCATVEPASTSSCCGARGGR